MATSIRTIASQGTGGTGTADAGSDAGDAGASGGAATEACSRAHPRPAHASRTAAILLVALGVLLGALLEGDRPAYAVGEGEPWAKLRPLRGEDSSAFVMPGQTLLDIALDYRVGFEAVQRLNPDLDPWVPPAGSVVHLPTRYILPEIEPAGLVVNVPEMRLYDFTSPVDLRVYAVSVGDPDDPTPIGEFEIGEKRTNPVWHVPTSIRTEKPWLPEEVPPGPDNPLGTRWMTLGKTSWGIHGTNVRWSIGRLATHGCIRLYEPDILDLYARVRTGTPVHVIYQPYKWGTDGKNLFLEAHPDIYGRVPDHLAGALALPRQLSLLDAIDMKRVERIVERQSGIPEYAGTLR